MAGALLGSGVWTGGRGSGAPEPGFGSDGRGFGATTISRLDELAARRRKGALHARRVMRRDIVADQPARRRQPHMAIGHARKRQRRDPGVEDALSVFDAKPVAHGGPDFGPCRFRQLLQWKTHHSSIPTFRQIAAGAPSVESQPHV